jgi:hypothetical protein
MTSVPPPGILRTSIPKQPAVRPSPAPPQPTPPPNLPSPSHNSRSNTIPHPRSEEQISWSSDEVEGTRQQGAPGEEQQRARLHDTSAHPVDPAVEVCEADSRRAAASRQGIPSYKEVLLGAAAPHQRCPNRQRGRHRSLTVEDGVIAEVRQQVSSPCRKLEISDEGWHEVQSKRTGRRTVPRPDGMPCEQDKRRSHFFKRMKGLCFNCLAKDHKVVSCHNPSKCWRCRRYDHISTDCPSRRSKQPPITWEVFQLRLTTLEVSLSTTVCCTLGTTHLR